MPAGLKEKILTNLSGYRGNTGLERLTMMPKCQLKAALDRFTGKEITVTGVGNFEAYKIPVA
mgnify:FL=1